MICKLCRTKEAVKNGFCQNCIDRTDRVDWDEIAEKRMESGDY